MSAGFATATEENSQWPDYGRKWGPWKEWHGLDTYGPVDPEIYCEEFINTYLRSPNSEHYLVAENHHINWKHEGGPDDIMYYRVEI